MKRAYVAPSREDSRHGRLAALLPDHRHRLSQQPAAHRHRLREARRRRAGPLSPHGGLRSLLPDGQRREHRQGVQARRRAGAATRRPTATTWPASSRRSGAPSTSASTTSSRPAKPRHHAGCRQVHPEGVRQRLHLQGQLRGLVLRGLRGVQDRDGDPGGRRRLPDPQDAARPPQRAVLFLRAVEVPGAAAASSTRRIPDFIQPESRRNEVVNFVAVGPARRQHHARAARPGASACRSMRSSPSTSGSTPC